MRRGRVHAALGAGCLFLVLPVCVVAGMRVPADASVRLRDARIDLASGALEIAGTLTVANGTLEGLTDLRVTPDGQLLLGTGLVRLGGDWDNGGSIDAASARVEFIDGSADSSILGETLFGDLAVTTTFGRRLRLQSGATQQIAGALVLRGTGAPLRIDSTVPAGTAFLALADAGSQDIANVAVWDVHATGQWLAPGETNQGGNANASRWFGAGGAVPPPLVRAPAIIPVDSPWALLALLAGMLLLLRRHVRTTPLFKGN